MIFHSDGFSLSCCLFHSQNQCIIEFYKFRREMKIIFIINYKNYKCQPKQRTSMLKKKNKAVELSHEA